MKEDMAGYAEDFSKSNNALEAESNGSFAATVLAERLGVKPGAIRALLSATEWHHTSKHYNITDYYSEESALEIIDDLRAWREPAKDVAVFENCTGSYLEWSGTRNHPHAKQIDFGPVRVTKKGKWFTLELASGAIRKGETTRGFNLFDANKRPLTFNR
jgi:hypothetical protein